MVARLWLVVAGVAFYAHQIECSVLRAGRTHLATGISGEALVAGVARAVGVERGPLGGGREVSTSVAGGAARAVLVRARLAHRAVPPVGACVSCVALAGIYIATDRRGKAVVLALLTHIERVQVLVCQTGCAYRIHGQEVQEGDVSECVAGVANTVVHKLTRRGGVAVCQALGTCCRPCDVLVCIGRTGRAGAAVWA